MSKTNFKRISHRLSALSLLGLALMLPHCSVKERDFSKFLGNGGEGSSGDGDLGGQAGDGDSASGGSDSMSGDGDGDGDGGGSSSGGSSTTGDGDGDTGDGDGDTGTGGGPVCEELSESQACEDKCGTVTVCDQDFSCGGCVGEATCDSNNECGCADYPCAISSVAMGDTQNDRIKAMAVDSHGAVYVLGEFRGTTQIGDDVYTDEDAILIKYSADGSVEWSLGLSESGTQTPIDVAVDGADNVIVALENYGEANLNGTIAAEDNVIAKFNSEGGFLWVVQASTAYSSNPAALSIDPATNDVYVGGQFWGSLKFGSLSTITAAGTNAYFDAYLLRINAAGTPQTLKRYGDDSEDLIVDLAAGSGFTFVAAFFNGTINFGVTAASELSSGEWYGLALAKVSSFGLNATWSRGFDAEFWETKLASDTLGNLFVAGSFAGDLTIQDPPLSDTSGSTFLAKLNTDGDTVWAKQFANVSISDMTTSSAGDLYVVGDLHGDTDLGAGPIAGTGNSEILMARFSADGDLVWLRSYSMPVGNQLVRAVAVAGSTVWAGDDYQGTIDLGVGSHQNQGGYDAAVARYAE